MRTVDFTPEVLRPYDVRFRPFDVPSPGVFDSPVICLKVNGSWASHVDGVLERLLYRDAWTGNDSEIERAIREVRKLLAALGAGDCSISYFGYDDVPLIDLDFQPGNPFTNPTYTPPGYLLPPFYVGQDGAVMTDITRLPPGSLPTIIPPDGLARFRLAVTGPAVVLFEFITIELGGAVSLQVDENPATAQISDLTLDVISVPPETDRTMIQRVDIDAGEHVIDVTFLPKANDEIPFVNYGGGVKSVSIGRDHEMYGECGEMPPFDVRQRPGAPCTLDKTTDGGETWQAWANLRLCPPRLRTNPVTGELEYTTDEGETWTPFDRPDVPPRSETGNDALCLAAANAVNVLVSLHFEVAAKISVPTGLLVAGAIAGLLISILFVPFSVAVILAILSGGGLLIFAALPFGAFTQQIQDELKCILYCNASQDAGGVVTFDFAAVKSAVQANIQPLNMWAGLDKYLDIIQADGLNRAGATTGITTANCSACECDPTWCYTFDFRSSAAGWTQFTDGARPNEVAQYVAGEGWRSGVDAANGVAYLFVGRNFSQTTVTRVEVTYSNESDASGNNGGAIRLLSSGNQTFAGALDGSVNHTSFTQTYTIADGALTDAVRLPFDAGSVPTPYGEVTIHAVTLYGMGNNPFGTDNCT